jgi:hypothetical protein
VFFKYSAFKLLLVKFSNEVLLNPLQGIAVTVSPYKNSDLVHMKQIILIFLTGLFFTVDINSQTETEYKHFIGGSLNTSASMADYKSDNIPNSSNQKVGLGFYYGFIHNKISFGFGMDGLNQIQGYDDLSSIEINRGIVMFYPFIRYKFDNRLFIHSQFDFGTSYIIKKIDSQLGLVSSADAKKQISYWMIGTTIGLGYSIKCGDRFLIEPMYKILYSYNSPLDKKYKTYKASDIMIDIAVIYKLR